MGKILSINVSKNKGEIKRPVNEVLLIKDFGIEGDAHFGFGHRKEGYFASVEEGGVVKVGDTIEIVEK
jgi:cyclic pyranopterin phosphate synthase